MTRKIALIPLADIADERETGSVLVTCSCGYGDCPICYPEDPDEITARENASVMTDIDAIDYDLD